MPWITQTYTDQINKLVESPAWVSGARTVATFSNDGAFTFKVGQSTGIVCGLNNKDLSASPNEIKHGFSISATTFRIIEKGAYKTSSQVYNKSHIFKIERINGVVSYYVNNVFIYTSLTASSGVRFLDCSMYAYGDTIIDALCFDYATIPNSGNTTGVILLPSLDAFGTTEGESFVSLYLPLFEVDAKTTDLIGIDGTLPALNGQLVTDTYQFINGTLPSIDAIGYDIYEIPEYNALNVELPLFTVATRVQDIDNIEFIIELPPLIGQLAQDTLNFSTIELPAIKVEIILAASATFSITWPTFTASIQQLPATLASHSTRYNSKIFKKHTTTYRSEHNDVTAIHEVSWKGTRVSSWQGSIWSSDTQIRTQKSHTTSWNSIGTSSVVKIHSTSWNSIGTSSVVKIHTTSWNSIGTFFTQKSHTTSWNSIGTSSVVKIHSTSWNSIGTSFTQKSHTTSWNSIGTSSVVKIHTTSWNWQPLASLIHEISWKSVIQTQNSHTSIWQSGGPAIQKHESSYRSSITTPLLILGEVYAIVNNQRIELRSVHISADEDSPYYQCDAELLYAEHYALMTKNLEFTIKLFSDSYNFILDHKELQRTVDDDSNVDAIATISGLSPICNYASPRSSTITKTWNTAIYASAIVTELLGSVDWNLIDWVIPAYRFAVENMMPLDAAQQIVESVGGVIESRPDGTVVIRSKWPTPINELNISTPDYVLDERHIFSISESSANDIWMNKIRIIDVEASFQDQMEFTVDENDPWKGVVNVYLSPWREGLRLVTTRPSAIVLDAYTEQTKQSTETVTFAERKSSTAYPIMTLDNVTWLDEDLGQVLTVPYATTLESGTGTYEGYSLAEVKYTTKYRQYPITCLDHTQSIEAQLLLLELQQ